MEFMANVLLEYQVPICPVQEEEDREEEEVKIKERRRKGRRFKTEVCQSLHFKNKLVIPDRKGLSYLKDYSNH